jgi:Protein of unknown function (DUF1688)
MLTHASPAQTLLTARAVRERARTMLELGIAGKLRHFNVDVTRLEAVTAYVLDTIRQNYPTLDIPFHARWRHFSAGGLDRWGRLAASTNFRSPAEKARAAFDLAIVSVLLDAGAGPAWSYTEPYGSARFTRSEGLAVASFDMFASGLFSASSAVPLRADAIRLAGLSDAEIASGFQVTAENPMTGITGRADLMRRLGRVVAEAPHIFALHDTARPGGLYDHLAAGAAGNRIRATNILEALLQGFGPMWPGRLQLDGVSLGDCWHHPALVTADATTGLVPFHKLSQWLAYSLMEPLQEAGFEITGIDGLTGLPEYRNGGLFLDLDCLTLKDEADRTRAHEVGAPLIVEWRALTVALLDEVGASLRERLGFDSASFPLAKALEGGTWAAGRRIAREKRKDGSPPLTVISDGTVF